MRVRSVLATTAVLLASLGLAAPQANAATEYNSLVIDDSVTAAVAYLAPNVVTSAVEDPTTHVVTLQEGDSSGVATWRTLTPPTGQQLEAFTTYPLAEVATDTAVGVAQYAGGCGTSGTLTVHDLVRDGGGAITALAVDFAEGCPGTTPPLYLVFRAHSSTPEPPTTRLLDDSFNYWTNTHFFPYLDPGAVATPTPFYLKNVGPTPAPVGTVSVVGANAADFPVTSNGCAGKTLLTDETCTIQVTFSPTAYYQRTAQLQVTDGSLLGLRTFNLSGYAVGPPGPVTAATATTRSDGVQVRWTLPADTGGSSLQYVEVLRGEAADSLETIAQLPGTATTFGDALGSATAPIADHDYVYGVRVHSVGGDSTVVTVNGHTPASVAPTTGDALVTVDGAAGAPNFPAQGFMYDASAGATMTVTAPGGLLVQATRAGAPNFGLSKYPGELSAGTSTTPFGLSKASQTTSTCSGTPAESTFDVHEVAYNSNGGFARLAADYLVRCTLGGPAVGGAIRWHSDLPYTAADVTTPAAGFNVKSGATTPLLVTYRNRGTTSITVTGLQLLPSGAGTTQGWSVLSDGCANAVLAAGEQCTTSVGVTPTAVGAKEVLVAFDDSTPTGQRARKLNVRAVLPPHAPVLSSYNAGTQGIGLSWDIIDGGDGATTFQIYRKLGSASFTHLASVAGSTPFQGHFVDPYLGAGPRSYLVRGVNAAGTGAYSKAATALVGPQVPRALVVAGLTRRVVVNWQAPASSFTTQPLSGYAVSRVSSTGALVRLGTVKIGSVLSYPITGLAPGTKVGLRVQALYGTITGPASTALVGTATSSSLLFVRNGWLMGRNLSGGSAVQVDQPKTFSPQYFIEHSSPPALSPSRQYFVASMFNGQGGYPYRLVVRRTDGAGSPRFLTPEAFNAFSPAVSHDGKWVAFTRAASDGHAYLYRIPWGGGTPTLIPNSKDLDEPSWSADGKSVYASRIADSKLGVVRLTLGGTRRTISSGRNESPVVSPDGKTVTFFTRSTSNVSSLKVLTVSTGAIKTLISNTGGWATRASWTPDSSTIYFALMTGALKSIKRDGTGAKSLPGLGSGARFAVYESW